MVLSALGRLIFEISVPMNAPYSIVVTPEGSDMLFKPEYRNANLSML